jgi:hypothetical protein
VVLSVSKSRLQLENDNDCGALCSAGRRRGGAADRARDDGRRGRGCSAAVDVDGEAAPKRVSPVAAVRVPKSHSICLT